MRRSLPADATAPCVIFLGDETSADFAKTGIGIRDWRPERCVGQIRLSAGTVDLGLPELTIDEAKERGARNMVVGIANIGGGIPDRWLPSLTAAARAGLSLVAGMHERLSDNPVLREAARAGGAALIDVRLPPDGIPVASGRKREGKRLLTLGTDCAVGKKYTALAIAKEMRSRSMKCTFRPTGQTGIMIEGCGLPIDAVICDFTAGAAEMLSPDNHPDHWDVIEGQGALTHPAYAGVTLGLLHGSQPDAFVLCHDAKRMVTSGWPDFPLPSISEAISMTMLLGRRTNPSIRCAGISINTSALTAQDASALLERTQRELGLPAVDPVTTGVGPIVDRLAEF